MRKMYAIAAGLLVSVGVAAGIVSTSQAAWSDSLRAKDGVVTIAEDETHQGSLYATGEKVVIEGNVTGTVYCAAGEVTISGSVDGDVLCAAQTLKLDEATVRGDVRVAGQYIEVSGGIGGSVTAFGQDVKIGDNTQIAGDLNGATQKTVLDGSVAGSLVSGGQMLELNGRVGNNADVSYASIDINDSAKVGGNFNYSSAREQDINTSVVEGEVSYNPAENKQADTDGLLGASILFSLALLVTGLVVAALMPRFLHRSSEVLRRQGVMTVLLGFAIALGMPIILFLLFLSLFLAPLAGILLLAWLLVSALSGIFFAYYIGSVLLRGVDNILLRMLGGSVVLLILYMIPIVNIFVLFAAWIVGSGMVVATLVDGYRRPAYSVAQTEVKKPVVKKRVTKK